VDWIVGVAGGIPVDRPVWRSVTDPPYGADPTGARDSSPAFNRALEDMPEGCALFVPPGTYRLDSGIGWKGKGNRKTLRGAGPGASRLIFYWGLIEMGPGVPEGRSGLDLNARRDGLTVDADLSRDAVKGETHVHLAVLPPWVKPGHLYIIDQLDDPEFVKSGGSGGSSHPRERTGNGDRGLGQIVRVTSVRRNGPSDVEVHFEIPLYYGFRTSRQAQIAMAGYDAEFESPLFDCGIEDLSMEARYATGWSKGVPGHFIRMDSCANCWVKNVAGDNVPSNCHVWASFCYRLEIRDSCFSHSHGYGGGEAYGVALYNVTSATLVENNVLRHLHCPLVVCYGASGNVFGYNYVFEGASESVASSLALSTHATHAYMNLWEGNRAVKMLADWYHGSNSHGILYRNRLLGWEPRDASDHTPVGLEYYCRKWSMIGNLLGVAGFHDIYEKKNGEPGTPLDRVIYKLGYRNNYACSSPPFDDLETLDLIRHGNWDAATGSVRWDPAIRERDLPPSLYLDTKPAWFGDLPWPAFGPDVPGLEGRLPAHVRFWGDASPPQLVPPPPA
jgi:hypothetical protein